MACEQKLILENSILYIFLRFPFLYHKYKTVVTCSKGSGYIFVLFFFVFFPFLPILIW